MKKLLVIFSLTISTCFAFGQSEKATSKTVAENFEKNYNADNFDSIFSNFSIEMQKGLPLQETKEFFSGLKQDAGKIKKLEFLKYDQEYASYKTNFERAQLNVSISVDHNSKINGFFIKPFENTITSKLDRNSTRLTLPFKDEWTVVWGGDTKELNYHVESEAQKNAFDLVITDNKEKSYKTDGKTNEDYYAFGKELYAPCDGEIVLVVDGIKDNVPGILNPIYIPGNSIIVKTDNNEYLFFAHLKQNSIGVKQGQKIKQGKLLGLCGNSGNSSEAHLHFHIQNIEDMSSATGIKCYFEKILVNGTIKDDYSPVQNEKISNIKKT